MNNQKKNTRIYFTTVVALSNDMAVFGGHMVAEEDDPSFTRLVMYKNGNWGVLGDIHDIIYSLIKQPNPSGGKPYLCALGRDGFFRQYVSGAHPIDLPIPKRDVTYLENIRFIGSHLYVCGGQNQLFILDEQIWKNFDYGIYSIFKGKLEKSLLSIDGYADNDIYAVGQKGATYHWDGRLWLVEDIPTNLSLNCVRCMSNGNVFICGDGGSLFVRNIQGHWIDLSNPEITTRSLWDMTEYEGFCYIAAENKLLRTDGKKIDEINVPLDDEFYFYSLDAFEKSLWVVGSERIYQFNGADWKVLICPDNE